MSSFQNDSYSNECSIFLTASDRNRIWNACIRECDGYLSRANFDRIIREVYGEILSLISNTDSESSSSDFSDTRMEATNFLINKYDHSIIDESYISKLRSNTLISSIGNEEDVILEPCVVGESVCITRPKGVLEEYFYFYLGVI